MWWRSLMIVFGLGLMIGPGFSVPVVAHEPTTYHVSAGFGNDNNDGLTVSSPWRTLAKANAAARRGDRVLMYDGTYRDPIAPQHSGTAQMRITYRAVAGEAVIIEGARRLIELHEKSHVTVEGIMFRQPVKSWGEIRDGHNNEIINNTFIGNGRGSETSFSGLYLFDSSSFNRIAGNVFREWGEASMQWGDAVRLSDAADYNVIEGNIFINAGHSLLGIDTSFNIIRRNYFENAWQKGIDLVWRVNPSFAVDREFAARRNVIEDNTFVGGRPTGGIGRVGPGIQLAAAQNIIRRNVFLAQERGGIYINGWSEAPNVYGNRIYHNTIVSNGGIGIACLNFGIASVNLRDNEFKNNIIHGNGWQSDNVQVRFDLTPRAGFGPDYFQSYAFAGNGVSNAPMIDIPSLAGRQPLAFYQEQYPQFVATNFSVEPQFENITAGDYRLTVASPGIDAALPLTVTAAEGSGTTVPVIDASYFTDGYGLKAGDRVKIGANPAVVILRIDDNRHTLVIDDTITWEAGEAVYLSAFNGQRPDVGAFEYGAKKWDIRRTLK